MALWRGKKVFLLLLFLILKCDSPSPLAFLALCPFVCVCLCGYQPKCSSRSLGAAALPCLMALKGLCTAKKILVIYSYHPLFLLHASCRLLCRGDAVPDKRLFCCFGAAVGPGGIPAAGGQGRGC